MQSAEIHQFPVQERQAPKGPQLEDGYTRIANELFEAVTNAQTCPVTLRQMRVVLAVIRKTFGFNKKTDRISDGQIAAETGLSRQNVNKAKRELIAMNVLFMDGQKIGVNKYAEQWDFSAKPEKDNLRQTRDSVSKPETKNVSKSGSHKRQKDNYMNTYVFIAHRLPANALVDLTKTDFKISPVKNKPLPACPHMAIIDKWAEFMADKPQPAKNLWHNAPRAKHLAARWKAGFSIKHERTGEPLYRTEKEGIEWWGKFFAYLRKSPFLMEDHRWFKLDWVVNKTNFTKIMEQSYHGGES
tara:strand:- start:623 stop:1519 length:897 start_codon:yes stop_codon:yes gene_type:complete